MFVSSTSVRCPRRIHRTEWLIGQRLDLKSNLFHGAPRAWASTYREGRPPGIPFDFTGTLHRAVPGKSWKEIKAATLDCGSAALPKKQARWQAAKNLIAVLAAFEAFGPNGFVHGDLSDGNVIIDPLTGDLHLIDFDAFVYTTSPTLKYPYLSVAEGGVKGTSGYVPLDLEAANIASAHPYSDRCARDMLLLELLGFVEGDPVDVSPRFWDQHEMTLESVDPAARALGLPYLSQLSVFTATERERPTSRQLAATLNL